MPKFIVEVEFDGYDSEEEMMNACTEDEVCNALDSYSFTVISVEKIEEDTSTTGTDTPV